MLITLNVRAVGAVPPKHLCSWGYGANREVGSCRCSDKSRLRGVTARTLGRKERSDCALTFGRLLP